MSSDISNTADAAALRRVIERLSQRLREIERARSLPPSRKEIALSLGVDLATVSRWRRQGLPPDATPEEAAEWRRNRCNTLQHPKRRRKHKTA